MVSQLAMPVTVVGMSAPDITQAEIDSVKEVLETGRLSIGPRVVEFERAFANYVGTSHAVAVNSGTSALHLAVIASGIGEGDEVLTPSFSFVASANCVLYERAKPVFVDVDLETGNIDPIEMESAITERTKAIIAVHAFGQPADMDPIGEIARRHQLIVIEDACEAMTARSPRRTPSKRRRPAPPGSASAERHAIDRVTRGAPALTLPSSAMRR